MDLKKIGVKLWVGLTGHRKKSYSRDLVKTVMNIIFHRRFSRSAEGLLTVGLTSMELHDPYHQHKEEYCCPGGSTWQLQDHLRVREEDKSWSTLHHIGHFCPLLQSDVAQDREGHTAG